MLNALNEEFKSHRRCPWRCLGDIDEVENVQIKARSYESRIARIFEIQRDRVNTNDRIGLGVENHRCLIQSLLVSFNQDS